MSTTHTPHPDVHEHGLADDCDRCMEHAEQPLRTLDDEVLRDLIQRIVEEEDSRSEHERIAMIHMKRALDEASTIAELHPILFAKYVLRTRGLHMVAVVKET